MKYLILVLALLYPLKSIVAKEGTSKPVDPVLYSIIKQQAFMDQQITASMAANLSPSALYDLVLKAQTATAVSSIGSFRKIGNDYEATTGIIGAAVGEMNTGKYRLKAISVDSVELVLPEKEITISKELENVITIVLKNNGRLGYVTYRTKSFLESLKNLFMGKKQDLMKATIQKVPVVIRLINDKNGNGELDKNEKLVPWANVIIQLIKK